MKRTLLVKIHLYCGLFTVFYLIAFGFSSIVLNHDLELEKSQITKKWDALVDVDHKNLENKELAESVKNELGLMGWTPFWLWNRDGRSFSFTVTHPGRNYHIQQDLISGEVLVAEAPKGFWAVVNGLHFLNGNIPNAPFLLRTWAVYQWLALLTMLLSLFLGMWLWIKYHYQTWEGLMFGGVFVITIFIMFLI